MPTFLVDLGINLMGIYFGALRPYRNYGICTILLKNDGTGAMPGPTSVANC